MKLIASTRWTRSSSFWAVQRFKIHSLCWRRTRFSCAGLLCIFTPPVCSGVEEHHASHQHEPSQKAFSEAFRFASQGMQCNFSAAHGLRVDKSAFSRQVQMRRLGRFLSRKFAPARTGKEAQSARTQTSQIELQPIASHSLYHSIHMQLVAV